MAKGITKPMYKRMLAVSLVLVVGCFLLLAIKLFTIQILDYKKYQQKAIEQQTRDVTIAPKRGTIFDRNGKELAVSATAYMVYINPQSIKDGEKTTKDEKIELISTKLAEILGVPKEDLLASCNKKNYYEVVARRIEQEKADAVNAFIKEYEMFSTISVTEDPKRYYPFNNFASHVLGFTGSDNQGLAGLEQYYDEYLRGTPGRIITATDAKGNVMPTDDQMYIAPQNGYSLQLTIDEVIQHYLEKAMDQAVVDANVKNRSAGIIMDVTTGEILAMAVKPDFNLNEPRVITDPEILATLAQLNGDEKNKATSTALQEMWRNKAVNDQYMPGSVYKILTASYALEENVVNLNDRFNCSGSVMVEGWDKPIRCDKRIGHGPETFVQGFQNSCNPVFIGVGLRVGIEKTCAYTTAYGLNKKTGIDLPGEAAGIVYNPKTMTIVDLAVQSFGQNIKITPIQMITAVSAAVNGGKLIKPTIVKEITDSNQGVVKSFTPEVVRQVVSEGVSQTVCDLMESVVTNGSGRNAAIPGYRIGGKTGTSEKIDEKNAEGVADKRIVSFCAVAPMEDPKIAILIMLDEPNVPVVSGGTLVAPAVKNVLADTLPYLGIEPKFTPEELAKRETIVPDLLGKTSNEAISVLEKLKLQPKISGGSGIITKQLPGYNQRVPAGGTVLLFTNNASPQDAVIVPNITGMTAEQANVALVNAGLNVKFSTNKNVSELIVAGCAPAIGTQVTPGSTVTVELRLITQKD